MKRIAAAILMVLAVAGGVHAEERVMLGWSTYNYDVDPGDSFLFFMEIPSKNGYKQGGEPLKDGESVFKPDGSDLCFDMVASYDTETRKITSTYQPQPLCVAAGATLTVKAGRYELDIPYVPVPKKVERMYRVSGAANKAGLPDTETQAIIDELLKRGVSKDHIQWLITNPQ